MTPTVRLGRIAGVAVGVHWSVLAIVVLIVAGLSTHFARTVPSFLGPHTLWPRWWLPCCS